MKVINAKKSLEIVCMRAGAGAGGGGTGNTNCVIIGTCSGK